MKRRGIGYGATVALAAGVFAAGWERQHPDKVPSTGCEALKPSGETATIVSYPLGKIAVQFQKDKLFNNQVERTIGDVTLGAGIYTLHVPGLPENLDNDYTEFRNTDAMVMVEAPKLGLVGITGACIDTKGRNVTLPTAEE